MRGLGVFVGLCLFAAACITDRAMAPGVFVLDDLGSGPWQTVSVGLEHSCALDLDGRAWCWGSNRHFQLGLDHADSACGEASCSLVPVPVATGRRFLSLSAGASHTCGITTDSVPLCWGSNHDGQVGVPGQSSPALQVVGGTPMIALAAGATHTCGIRADSLLACWGSNLFGAVGIGPVTGAFPTLVSQTQRFTHVAASEQKTCARLITGQMACWGALWVRTSGDTDFTRIRNTPEIIEKAGSTRAIGAGPSSSCNVDMSGFAWCWESNVHGERGSGPGPGSTIPQRVGSDAEFMSLTLGSAHACGITTTGSALCWGSNTVGQLGSSTTEDCGPKLGACSTTPVEVFGRQRFRVLSAGIGRHVCGVTDRNNLYCWGSGGMGQRGDGTRNARSFVPRLAAVRFEQ